MMRVLLLSLTLQSLATHAHEIQTVVVPTWVTVVTLRYADGEAFSYEQFEVIAEGATVPVQTGRTDVQGRAAILPVAGKKLNFRVASKDGHGAVLMIDPVAEAPATTAATTVPRWLLIMAGAGIIFGVFGLLQLWVRRR